jgi:protein ImuA
MRAEQIARLRASLAKPELPSKDESAPLGFAPADACLKGGLKRGACHEVFAHAGHETAATGFAAGLCARVAGRKPILWIRQDYCALEFGELAATGLLEFGLDPARFLLLRTAHAEDALKAALDALTCAELGAVAIELAREPKVLDLTASRRLTLAAAQKNVTAVLLRFAAAPDASSAETRWRIRGHASSYKQEDWGQPVFEAELVRNRHGGTGRWVMEWNCDETVFRAADRGAVVPAPFDRQAAAALEAHRRSAA